MRGPGPAHCVFNPKGDQAFLSHALLPHDHSSFPNLSLTFYHCTQDTLICSQEAFVRVTVLSRKRSVPLAFVNAPPASGGHCSSTGRYLLHRHPAKSSVSCSDNSITRDTWGSNSYLAFSIVGRKSVLLFVTQHLELFT
jgi:hypothetical protein